MIFWLEPFTVLIENKIFFDSLHIFFFLSGIALQLFLNYFGAVVALFYLGVQNKKLSEL